MIDTFQIDLGPSAPQLSEQLIAKHLTDKEIEVFQQDMDALNRLRSRRILTAKPADLAEIRLVKEIQRKAAKNFRG